MKTKMIIGLLAATVLTACSMSKQAEVVPAPGGMREGAPVATTIAQGEMPTYPKKTDKVARNWEGQPPVIPHLANKPINLKRNGCLMCHKAPKPGKKAPRATAVHISHFEADGKQLDNHFYNCHQCHVPQADNYVPVVGNSYNSAEF